ncbi:TPA: formate/nitrite transporter family protein [Candidatus Bathyarchaeota archaeon]|nr:formate/nitrite transporter family protein [Candidatus Bathyarchaeota archaeon]
MSRKPAEIAETICSQYNGKTGIPMAKVFLLAILAGAYVSFGGYLFIVVTSDAAAYVGYGLAGVIGGLVFSIGLILIVLGGGELFTGNGLFTISCLSGKARFVDMLKNWVTVYAGNLVGSLLLVVLVFAGGSYLANGGEVAVRVLQISSSKVGISFMDALIRGILCNWLVCLAVWLANSANDTTGKILAIIFPISAFVAMGFEHSVANMFFIPLGILVSGDPALVAGAGVSVGGLNLAGFVGNLIPVTIGNIIGGAVFVAAAYWYAYMRKQ